MDVVKAFDINCCFLVRISPEKQQRIVTRYRDTTRRLFTSIVKAFTPDDNSRWLLRHYLAIKFATATALLAGSAAFAYARNLLMGVPYFNYYALPSACRAHLLTSPQVMWGGVKIIEMNHENILNRTADYMRALDPSRRVDWRSQMATLRDRRELFSYRFPMSGPGFVGRSALDPAPSTGLTRLIAELAALNTECFDALLSKHVGEDMPVVDLSDHDRATAYELAGEHEMDPVDKERFGKLQRGWRTVSPLYVMTSDGMMDDLYGS